jgi:hypothetical protein
MSKSTKTKANTKANKTTDAAAASNSAATGNPKKSLSFNEAVIQVTFPRVTTPDKAALFSSKRDINKRRKAYEDGPDKDYLRALELNLLQESRQSLSRSKASNQQKDEIRNTNMEHISKFMKEREGYLKNHSGRSLKGTEHDIAKVPVAIHYSVENRNRHDGKSKSKGGKKFRSKRTRKNRKH